LTSCGSCSLNPLHCGAVVASVQNDPDLQAVRLVSIPFIAGQWSLHGDGGRPDRPAGRVSIPFIAGQWSLRERTRVARGPAGLVSIPFIAGQWSLLFLARLMEVRLHLSQSPSLRGSGRFSSALTSERSSAHCLNPLHCGAVVASRRRPLVRRRRPRVSIPFIAGQWSLR